MTTETTGPGSIRSRIPALYYFHGLMKPIPFSPPRIDQKTIDAVTEVLRSGWITTGPRTRALEERICSYTGARRTLCLNSWTNAVELALRWYGIGPGDEVIVPVYTYAASANIILHTGATPVFVDCEPNGFLCDVHAVASAITQRTKAIMPVDVGGMPVDYAHIMGLARLARPSFVAANDRQSALGRPLIIADAAHSFGARIGGEVLGSQADICGFSFHAVKNFTTAEGGALTLNLPEPLDNHAVWKQLAIAGLHGQTRDALSKSLAGQWEYDIVEPGYKCNLTDIQAAIGLVEMDRYEEETLPRRKAICDRYTQLLGARSWAILPTFQEGSRESSYHLYMLRINGFNEDMRNRLIKEAAEAGVSLNVHFQPLPRLTYYRESIGLLESDFPNAMAHFAHEVSLPVYYDLQDAEVERVVSVVVDSVQRILSGL